MKRLLIVVACVSLLFSCKKDEETVVPKNELEGEWRFVSMQNENWRIYVTSNDSTVYYFNDQSLSNDMGIYRFTKDSLFFDNNAYKTTYSVIVETFREGVSSGPGLTVTTNSYISTHNRTNYHIVGKDAVFIGTMQFFDAGGVSSFEVERTDKISYINDTLVLSSSYDSSRIQINDVQYLVYEKGTKTRKFVKQQSTNTNVN